MAEPFIAEIRIFATNFAPRGWAFCNGQLLPIAQNTALFSLVGTTYGGDGRTTFGIPNLQGGAPMHPGRGPGLTERRLGENGGSETVTLNEAQIANHTHTMNGSSEEVDRKTPENRFLGDGETMYRSSPADVQMAQTQLQPVGGGQAHNNEQPLLVLNFVIALVGLYPPRS
jgi:microcystin-dependent protein